jgi:murein DD-endopeptidase MepM/ murein hydrolase activator NlpD
MAKVKYYYDTKTLNYRRIEKTPLNRTKNMILYLGAFLFSGVIITILYLQFFDGPDERSLKDENSDLISEHEREESNWKSQLEILNKRYNEIDLVLQDLQYRDDNIYRVIWGADPIPSSIRKAGFGGVNRYRNLENMNNSDLVIETTKQIDIISNQLKIQSESYNEIIELAKDKEEKLASLPSIQPISNKDLKRMVSGWGPRIHPIYKTKKFHYGLDFVASRGTPVYATGNGSIKTVKYSGGGYGKHIIIDHGYGHETLYAHLSEYNVKQGDKIKRGEVIGFVGSTGRSVAPHLHYEVKSNNQKVNPALYFYEDLSAEEYDKMIEISSKENQSFDFLKDD